MSGCFCFKGMLRSVSSGGQLCLPCCCKMPSAFHLMFISSYWRWLPRFIISLGIAKYLYSNIIIPFSYTIFLCHIYFFQTYIIPGILSNDLFQKKIFSFPFSLGTSCFPGLLSSSYARSAFLCSPGLDSLLLGPIHLYCFILDFWCHWNYFLMLGVE